MKELSMKKKWVILVIYLLLVIGVMVGLIMTLPEKPKEVVIQGNTDEVIEID